MATKVSIKFKSEWEWCYRENTTYLDCPIATYGDKSFVVGIFNPSSDTSNYTSFAVPHAHYDVYVFKDGSYVNPDASVLCDKETLSNGQVINNCQLYVDYKISG